MPGTSTTGRNEDSKMAITRTGQKARITQSVIAGQPRAEYDVHVVKIDGDTLTYTTDANPSWYSTTTRSELADWSLIEEPGRIQVHTSAAGAHVLAETDGPQNLEVMFVGESVVITIADGDDATLVSIPRHTWGTIVEAGK